MDFQKIKEEAIKLKDKAQKASQDAIEFWASKIANSKLTLKSVDELEDFRKTSKSTEWKDSKTWKKKIFSHKSIVVFAKIDSDFFKSMLYKLPILETKTFSQSVKFKLADVSMKWLHKSAYEIDEVPSLVVFENEKIVKSVWGEEKIQKVVNSLSLDINKTIDEL